MRILHVIQQLGVGGAERIALTLIRGARGAGHDAAIAAAEGPLSAEANVPKYPLPLVERRLLRVPAVVRKLREALRAERPELVHVHNPAMALAVGVATMRGRRVPALVSVHGVPEDDYPAAARALRLAGLPVVSCGPAVTEALAAHGLSPLTTIPNGVPAPPSSADPARLRADWGLEAEQPLVLSVGRLVPQKNHSLAITAIARVPEVALAIVGEGPLAEELRAQAAVEGVADRVVFVGPRADAWALMGAADAVVLSSVWEGLPLTALEALAIGTPLIATDVRGLTSLLENELTALLVPPGDAPALAAAVQRVLDCDGLAQRLTAGGREVVARFDDDEMTRHYLRVYEHVADRRV